MNTTSPSPVAFAFLSFSTTACFFKTHVSKEIELEPELHNKKIRMFRVKIKMWFDQTIFYIPHLKSHEISRKILLLYWMGYGSPHIKEICCFKGLRLTIVRFDHRQYSNSVHYFCVIQSISIGLLILRIPHLQMVLQVSVIRRLIYIWL